jgi:hypothetical protein
MASLPHAPVANATVPLVFPLGVVSAPATKYVGLVNSGAGTTTGSYYVWIIGYEA